MLKFNFIILENPNESVYMFYNGAHTSNLNITAFLRILTMHKVKFHETKLIPGISHAISISNKSDIISLLDRIL